MRMTKIMTLALAVLAMGAILTPDLAFAQANGSVFGTLQNKATDTFTNVRIILFIIAGFGIIGMAAMAFFGRFDWRWTFSMGGGLVVLAAAGGIIYYATHNMTGVAGDPSTAMQGLSSQDTLQ
jgi:hypothetical protein